MSTPLRVMICDDSAVIRTGLSRLLENEADLRVVARCANGQAALSALETAPPEEKAQVILLDLEMPVMDGMTALPLLLRQQPRPVVIVASAVTQRGAAAAMAALKAGASDCIAKPSAADGGLEGGGFRAELLAKIRGWGRMRPASVRPAAPVTASLPGVPRVVCIGASTGGPQALAALVKRLPRALPVPLLLVQHMPAGFTTMLAQHLDGLGGPRVAEAQEGQALQAGHAYLAPGGRHMLVRAIPGGLAATLSDAPPENFCRPAVDPTLRSLVAACGARLHVIILTGMGHDGLAGCKAVAAAGGTIWAQDEASSVVWGMPGAVAKAGLAPVQAPPEALGDALATALRHRQLVATR